MSTELFAELNAAARRVVNQDRTAAIESLARALPLVMEALAAFNPAAHASRLTEEYAVAAHDCAAAIASLFPAVVALWRSALPDEIRGDLNFTIETMAPTVFTTQAFNASDCAVIFAHAADACESAPVIDMAALDQMSEDEAMAAMQAALMPAANAVCTWFALAQSAGVSHLLPVHMAKGTTVAS